MRELSSEVDTARKAAVDAVHRGEKVIDSWVQYRLTTARVRGRWMALSGQYQAIAGRESPPGPHAPELRAEPFDKFLRTAIIQAEVDAYHQANQQAQAEINAHRDKQGSGWDKSQEP